MFDGLTVSSARVEMCVIRRQIGSFMNWRAIYTLNHKKRDILFLTITLANLNRFSQFLYHFNHE